MKLFVLKLVRDDMVEAAGGERPLSPDCHLLSYFNAHLHSD